MFFKTVVDTTIVSHPSVSLLASSIFQYCSLHLCLSSGAFTRGQLIAAVEAMIARRSAGATNKNAHSSRSHAIFTLGTSGRRNVGESYCSF
jgi:hypothetical protein